MCFGKASIWVEREQKRKREIEYHWKELKRLEKVGDVWKGAVCSMLAPEGRRCGEASRRTEYLENKHAGKKRHYVCRDDQLTSRHGIIGSRLANFELCSPTNRKGQSRSLIWRITNIH